MNVHYIFFSLVLCLCFCHPKSNADQPESPEHDSIDVSNEPAPEADILTGADQVSLYLPKMSNRRVGLIVNQTSIIGQTHLVDSLQKLGIKISAIFAPEHGFRGEADAGAHIKNGIDQKTGIPIISLYGDKKAPTKEDLKDIDLLVFDIQDVGARFYTYLSTLKYVMESCVDNQKELIILDRPNPNGHYVDGPVLEKGYESFIGVLPIPVVHGMTLGELAGMMNGEQWLKNGGKANITVILCKGYTHKSSYTLPVKPSPNLPNQLSILLYPSLCLFEGTQYSVGRGTDKQFQIYGSPQCQAGNFYFTPEPKPGAMQPFLQGQKCRGYDLSARSVEDVKIEGQLNLTYLLTAYKSYAEKDKFFLKNLFIDKLAGSNKLRMQVLEGLDEAAIRASWQPELKKFKVLRNKYLLYAD